MPETPLGFITPGMRFMAWWRAPVEVMGLALHCVDPERDPAHLGRRVDERRRNRPPDRARSPRSEAPRRSSPASSSRISPVHTDDYYAERARAVARSPRRRHSQPEGPGRAVDARARAHARAGVARSRAGAAARGALAHDRHDGGADLPRGGRARRLAPCAPRCGRSRTAPRSRRPSRRSRTCAAAGFDAAIDDAVRWPRCRVLHCASRPGSGARSGCRSSTTCGVYEHQLPGGMTSTLRRQLAEVGMEDHWDAVLAELPRVREAAGLADHGDAALPVHRRPGVSQRHDGGALVADAGRGRPVRPRPVRAAARRDRSRGRGEACLARRGPSSSGTRSTGSTSPRPAPATATRISDEELLLRMMLPAEQVDAMRSGHRPTRLRSPIVDLIEGLATRPAS